MPYHEEGTFYLYGRRHDLGLGHLLLGNYKTPAHVPHCRAPPLSDAELAAWATTTEQSGTFTDARGWNINAEAEVFETGRLGGGQGSEKSRVIVATSGRRLELRSDKVRDFFQQKVLPAQGVKESLKRWLTVSRTNYVLTKARLKLKPEIWCLTGLFELNDVTAATVVKKNPSVSFGISSALVAALSGVPLGGSIEISQNFTITCDNKYPGKGVWAAQYQLINSRPVLRVESDEDPPMNYVELYPDYTYAEGRVLGGEDGEDDAFELEVEPVGDEDINVDSFDGEYWEAYREAEEITKNLNKLVDIDGSPR
ncbi:hypothetical protein BGZ57DRAFT_1010460 [Hyaloscypha finlandica]|nr:hypothetical protein BGZ57DRAFT_1010460 [Hyaloscypha finlandica]